MTVREQAEALDDELDRIEGIDGYQPNRNDPARATAIEAAIRAVADPLAAALERLLGASPCYCGPDDTEPCHHCAGESALADYRREG